MQTNKKVLIFTTNHATLGDDSNPEKNGTYSPEITHVIHHFLESGIQFDVASLKGGQVPIYGEDVKDPVNVEIIKNQAVQSALQNTIQIDKVNPKDYHGVFYPGGYGLLYDLSKSEKAGNITAAIFENGGVVGAVCHGPAGLLPVKLSNGDNIMKNITVTGFSREEEIDCGTINKIPYLLEESLTRTAGQYTKKGPWQELVITEGKIITGQNPQSASGVGRAMVAHLK